MGGVGVGAPTSGCGCHPHPLAALVLWAVLPYLCPWERYAVVPQRLPTPPKVYPCFLLIWWGHEDWHDRIQSKATELEGGIPDPFLFFSCSSAGLHGPFLYMNRRFRSIRIAHSENLLLEGIYRAHCLVILLNHSSRRKTFNKLLRIDWCL